MSGLLMVPKAEADESFFSYLLRLANANGFIGLVSFSRAQRLGAPDAVPRIPRDELWARLGVPAERAPRGYAVRWVSRHRKLGRSSWPAEVAWCPHCLAEKAYFRAIWESPIMLACAMHRVRLLRQCSHCKIRISSRSGSITQCRCGEDLRRSTCEPATPEECLFSERLSSSVPRGSRIAYELRELDAISQKVFMRSVASWVLNLCRAVDLSKSSSSRALERIFAETAAGRRFLNDPDAVFREGVARSVNTGRFSFLRFKFEAKMRSPPFALATIGVYRQKTRGVNFRDERGIEQRDVAARIAIRGTATASDLRLLFGGSHSAWSLLCESGFIGGVEQASVENLNQWLVPLKSVEALQVWFRWSLSFHEVAARLRINPDKVLGLTSLKMLPLALDLGRREIYGSPLCRFLISAVDNVIDLLETLSEERFGGDSVELVSLADPRFRFHRWTTLMSHVFAGGIRVYQVNPLRDLGMQAFAVPSRHLVDRAPIKYDVET